MIGNQNNLYHYSNDLNLSSFITIKNNKNNIKKKDLAILNQNISFLKDLANILENKLKNNIRLHQKGFEIYRQKLLSDKNLIINNIGNDFRNLSIKKLLEILKQIKEDDNKEMMNNLFNFGKNINKLNDNNIYYNNINMNNENQNSIEMINKMFNDYSNLKNIDLINSDKFKYNFNNMSSDENSKNNLIKYKSQNNGTNNKLGFKNLGYNDPRLIYHSPSPLIIKKQDSKIIEENKNANNQIDFDEPQNL